MALIVISAAITTSVAIGSRVSLWDDETATASEATRSVAQLLRLLSHSEGGLAGYVIAMRGWAALAGTSELALRLPSLAALAFIVVGAGWITWRTAGAFAAVVAAAAVALHPTLAPIYGIEARPYAVSTALAVLAALIAHRVSRGEGRFPYITWSVVAGAAIACHVLVVFAVAPQVLWLLPARRGDRSRAFALAVALPTAVAIAMVVLTARATVLQSWIDPITASSLLAISRAVLATGALAAIVASVPGLLLWRGRRDGSPAESPSDPVDLAVLIGWAALPLCALAFLSLVSTPTLVARYALSSAVPMAALAGIAVSRAVAGIRTRPRAVASFVATAVLLIGLVGAGGLYVRAGALRPADKPTDLRGAARWVLDHEHDGDGILYAPTWAEMGMRWYLVDSANRRPPTDVTAQSTTSASAAGSLFTPTIDPTSARARLAALRRIWIAGYGNETPWQPVPEVGIPLAMLVRRCWTPVDQHRFGITIELWARPATVKAAGCP